MFSIFSRGGSHILGTLVAVVGRIMRWSFPCCAPLSCNYLQSRVLAGKYAHESPDVQSACSPWNTLTTLSFSSPFSLDMIRLLHMLLEGQRVPSSTKNDIQKECLMNYSLARLQIQLHIRIISRELDFAYASVSNGKTHQLQSDTSFKQLLKRMSFCCQVTSTIT